MITSCWERIVRFTAIFLIAFPLYGQVRIPGPGGATAGGGGGSFSVIQAVSNCTTSTVNTVIVTLAPTTAGSYLEAQGLVYNDGFSGWTSAITNNAQTLTKDLDAHTGTGTNYLAGAWHSPSVTTTGTTSLTVIFNSASGQLCVTVREITSPIIPVFDVISTYTQTGTTPWSGSITPPTPSQHDAIFTMFHVQNLGNVTTFTTPASYVAETSYISGGFNNVDSAHADIPSTTGSAYALGGACCSLSVSTTGFTAAYKVQ